MAKVTEDFYTVLGKSKYDFKIEWNRVFKCIDVKGDGQIFSAQFYAAASNRKKLVTSKNNLEHAFK